MTSPKTNKAKFQLLMKHLEAGGWDFFGYKGKTEMKKWWIEQSYGYSLDDVFLRLCLESKNNNLLYFGLAEVLGSLSTRKIVFGEGVKIYIQEEGKPETKEPRTYFWQYYGQKMFSTGEPPQWLDYAVKFIKGKK